MSEIKNWIRNQLDANYRPEEIKSSLKDSGYDPNLVDEVLREKTSTSGGNSNYSGLSKKIVLGIVLIGIVGVSIYLLNFQGFLGAKCPNEKRLLDGLDESYRSFKNNISDSYKSRFKENFTEIDESLDEIEQLVENGNCEEAEAQMSDVSEELEQITMEYINLKSGELNKETTQVLSCSAMSFDIETEMFEISGNKIQFPVMVSPEKIKTLILETYKDDGRVEKIEKTVNVSPGTTKMLSIETDSSTQGVDKVVIKSKNCPGVSATLTKSGGNWRTS